MLHARDRCPFRTSMVLRAAALVVFLQPTTSVRAGDAHLASRHDPEATSQTGWGNSTAVAGASMSADGRWVIFTSDAPDLVPGVVDTNDATDVFLYDDLSGTVRLVSHSASNPDQAANGASFDGVVCKLGQYVAFTSLATDLVAGQVDTNQVTDVFTCPTTNLVHKLVSRTSAVGGATTANGASRTPVLNADGFRIVFASFATNVFSGLIDGNGVEDVFVFEQTGGRQLASHTSLLSQTGSGAAGQHAISDSGQVALFVSRGANHVAFPDANGANDVFLWLDGPLLLVSRGATTAAGGDLARMSADADKIAYQTPTDLAVGCDGNGLMDVYLYDRSSGTTTLVSKSEPGCNPSGQSYPSYEPHVSPDGLRVTFRSDGSLLSSETPPVLANYSVVAAAVDVFEGKVTSVSDAFISDDGAGFFFHGIRDGWEEEVSCVNFCSGYPDRRARHVLVASPRSGLVTSNDDALDPAVADANGQSDLFLQSANQFEAVSLRDPSTPVPASATAAVDVGQISDDGRFMVTTSDAGDLDPVTRDVVSGSQVYLHDLVLGTAKVMGEFWADVATEPAISRDGRRVAYVSRGDIIVYDRQLDSYERITWLDGYPDGESWDPRFDGAGTHLTFTTMATDLDPLYTVVDTNGAPDVYCWSAASDLVTLVSHAWDGFHVAADAGSRWAVMDAGEPPQIVFTSEATNLVEDQDERNDGFDLFLQPYDHHGSPSALVTRSASSPPGVNQTADLACEVPSPAIDDDGTIVTFACPPGDLIGGPVGYPATEAILAWDVASADMTVLAQGNQDAKAPVMSRDGSFVAFESTASDVLPGQVDPVAGSSDVFAVFVPAAERFLVSHRWDSACAPSCLAANGPSRSPSLSPDGQSVAFVSTATDLVNVGGQLAGTLDVFLSQIGGPSELVSHRDGSVMPGNKAAVGALVGGFPPGNLTVAFSSNGTNHTTDLDTNAHRDVFFHRQASPSGFPGEVQDLRWSAKNALLWSAEPDALAYRAYRGAPADLPALLTSGDDSCRRWQGGSTTIVTTGAIVAEDPAPGTFFWYLVDGVNFTGEGPPGNATAGPRVLNSTGSCP